MLFSCSGSVEWDPSWEAEPEVAEVEEPEPPLAALRLESRSGRGDRLRCEAEGGGGREAELRLRVDDGEAEFRAKWEIDKGQGQVVGTVVSVAIDGVFIGGIVLEDDGDQLEGDIEFEEGNFPPDFPDIVEGTPVAIGSLACTFEED